MQVLLGETDVTSVVQENSYKIDKVTKYNAWKNANRVEVWSNVHEKIEGSFTAVFIPDLTMSYADFKTALDAVTTARKVTTMSLTVNNEDGALETINAHVTIEFEPMIDLKNGSDIIFKRATITVKEC